MLSFVPHSRTAVIYGAAQGFSIPVQIQTEENNPCIKGKSLNNSMRCIIILVGGETFRARLGKRGGGFSVVFRNFSSAVKREEVPDCFSRAFQKLIWVSWAGGAELVAEYSFDFSEHLCRAVQTVLTRLRALKLASSQTRNSLDSSSFFWFKKKKGL